MNRQNIKLGDVKVPLRFRKDMGDIGSLARSIERYGLIQPIVLTPDFTLVAGERRFRAHEYLKREVVDYVLVNDLPEEERHELELEENIRRKSMTWQEECLGILHIYRIKRQKAALEGWKWGQELAAEMFNMALGTVNYVLVVAKRLEEEKALPMEKRRIWAFDSVSEAYRLGVLMEQEDAALAKLAEIARKNATSKEQETYMDKVIKEVKAVEAAPDLLAERKKQYESNPHNVMPFEQYWAEKQALAKNAAQTIWLSTTLLNQKCIEFMMNPSYFQKFDHIITDPPYAIDLEMMNQGNVHGGMVDIDRVEDTHQVEENMELLKQFFPAAFYCTKEKGFTILFCDVMLWDFLYGLATEAGFEVQRWPVIWRKVNQSCMNNAAMYNSTKDYEVIMVCRKPGTTVAQKLNTSFIDGSNAEVTKLTGHPFAKPFEVTKKLLETYTTEGQLILEPFAGGGSMVIEMLRNNRRVIALEKEVHQYNALLENVKRIHYLKLNPDFVFK